MSAASSGPAVPLTRRARRVAVRWCLFLGTVYLGCLLVLWSFENSMVFRPLTAAESWNDRSVPPGRDVWLANPDGTKIHAWWYPPDRPDAGAILLAHGNGGNLSHRSELALELRRTLGAGVLLFDYPGYGKSVGKPTEAGCYAAADAAYEWLTGEAKIPSHRIIILGESLGGGVAVHTAANHDCRALVLMFTFTTLPAAAKTHFRWLPTYWLMRNRFDNMAKIGSVKRPVFIMHGTADEVIPYKQGEVLFAAANEPKEFLRLEGFGHNSELPDEFFTSLARFLERTAP